MHTHETRELELHPLCTIFPRLTGPEFDALSADIAEHGLRQPIVLHDGMILDGGNRYRACLTTGTQPCFEIFGGASAVAYVLSANLHRRHMTVGQQAAIVASAQDWANAQTVGKPRHVAVLATVADRAAQSGASERTQQRADTVAKQSPELALQVAHGEKTLPQAIKELRKTSQEGAQELLKDRPATTVATAVEKTQPAATVEAEGVDEVRGEGSDLAEQLEKARDVAADLAEEVETLRAAGSVEGAEAEIARLKAMLRAVEAERDMYRNKSNEMVKQIRAMQSKIAKLEKPA
jgi:hypothetical protein